MFDSQQRLIVSISTGTDPSNKWLQINIRADHVILDDNVLLPQKKSKRQI